MIEPNKSDIGRFVIYVPKHAKGNVAHKDCERGVIKSFNGLCVFVQYSLGAIGKGTSRADLYWEQPPR